MPSLTTDGMKQKGELTVVLDRYEKSCCKNQLKTDWIKIILYFMVFYLELIYMALIIMYEYNVVVWKSTCGTPSWWRICKDMNQIYTCVQVEAVFVIFWFVYLFSVVVAPKNEVFLHECRNPYIDMPLMTPMCFWTH